MNKKDLSRFEYRHIGIQEQDLEDMLEVIGSQDLDTLIDDTIPDHIRLANPLNVPKAMTEYEYLSHLKDVADKNQVYTNFIGQGYYGTITPSPILRNIFQNPAWYTQYTPYQAEIAQGRLESLLNFQTMVSDLTGMEIANASLLDEATAAAEAMSMFLDLTSKTKKDVEVKKFFVDSNTFTQTIDVLITRALPLGIEIVIGDYQSDRLDENYIGALVQYPNAQGSIVDYRSFAEQCHEVGAMLCVAADLLSLTLLTPPGEWGADAVVGNTQRFGVPMGFGGPHAAYFATHESNKRVIPGRIIGLSKDIDGNPALRMALQTREQHIKREKATSNICTAQALLANMAGMYAVYHGPEGLRQIAETIHSKAASLVQSLIVAGVGVVGTDLFDTITIPLSEEQLIAVANESNKARINLNINRDSVSISIDETTTWEAMEQLASVLSKALGTMVSIKPVTGALPSFAVRTSEYLTHPVFHMHRSETQLMRYIKSLENKDLSLVHSMIALGSCTMKLNAATELMPVSWPEFANMHPFAPTDQTAGYRQIFTELEAYLSEITGFAACSLQPNSGAQGEYAGLMCIMAYHSDHGQGHRNIALIPSSAHGTNPASAVMAGMQVVVVKCDDEGSIDVADLYAKIEAHRSHLAALMVTYPSTHGVFETAIVEICSAVHEAGGLVYMDGANMNAQVGLTSPGAIGADVCHLNLHKTFAIPHGGGGPGMGPICVNERLAPYLPGHAVVDNGGNPSLHAVSAAPWGSASILLISYGYIRMLGQQGLTNSTIYAILNANYIRKRLEHHYSVLYTGEKGMVAHELIIDLRQFKPLNISAEDVAKRLIDYGFHAPTLSFPVAGTIMIEPTESEDKAELDRFCDAMIMIKHEIDQIASGNAHIEDNVLRNAPHTLYMLTADQWDKPYSRSEAAYALPYLRSGNKFWATVRRVDNAYGDRNLVCTCPPIESYDLTKAESGN